jgi:hypothetical protein
MAALLDEIVDRRLDEVVSRRMELEPVVVLQGPRAVGKSTLLRELAIARGREVIDLDDLGTRDAVAADPALFVRGEAPVLIDEFQQRATPSCWRPSSSCTGSQLGVRHLGRASARRRRCTSWTAGLPHVF